VRCKALASYASPCGPAVDHSAITATIGHTVFEGLLYQTSRGLELTLLFFHFFFIFSFENEIQIPLTEEI
jgi:hypothetical protein